MTSASVRGAIPETGFIRDYIDWAQTCIMAPVEFHLAGALAAMATLLGNRIFFPLGGENYPAALWMVLMASSGGKKSSAMRGAFRLLDETTGRRYRLATEMSREALWDTLHDRPIGYIQMSEFMSFLEVSRRDYMSGITSDLCNFFDCPEVETRTTVSRGDITVRRPAVTIVGAAVAEAVSQWVRSRDLVGGFFSRFLFIVQDSAPAYLGMVDWDSPARDDLKAQLADIVNTPGVQVTATPQVVRPSFDAQAEWEEYDRRIQESPDARIPEFSGLFSRAGLYAMKLAMCYALAANRGGAEPFRPQKEDMVHAVWFVEWCRLRMMRLVEDTLSVHSREGQDMERIRRAITRLDSEMRDPDGWVPWSDVLRRTHLTSRRMTDLIDTMTESGVLEFSTDPTSERGRKVLRLKEEEE